jgi:AraC-like DNA-binding protein
VLENEAPPRLLDEFPAIRSSNISEIEHLLASTYGARRFIPSREARTLDVHANHWQSEAIALSYCDYGASVEVQFPEANFYRQQFALTGSSSICIAGTEREIGPNKFCVVPPGSNLNIHFRAELKQIVLRLNDRYLWEKHRAITGHDDLPTFQTREHEGGESTARLFRLLQFFSNEIGRGGLSNLEIREIEQSIAIGFLRANNFTTYQHEETPKQASTGQIHRAEEYIRAHWNVPISIDDLTTVSGVSGRTLFYHYRKRYGQSPMAFVRDIRLNHARRMLSELPEMTVTQVALACGFGNLGHFSRYYQARWGEVPSATRRRHDRLRG